MKTCDKCKKVINEGEEYLYNLQRLCEDCYIDILSPRVRKMYYENDASFMLRLKDSYSAFPQKYH